MNMMLSQAERVFNFKHFAAVRKTFNSQYPDKNLTSKTTIHRLVTLTGYRKCLSVTCVHRATQDLKAWPYRLQACIGCNDLLLRRFVRKGVHV